MLNFLHNFHNKNKSVQQVSQPPVINNPIQQRAVNEVLASYLDQIKNNQLDYAQNLANKIGADNVANGVAQGLNFGIPQIADWQRQYNAGSGRENPIKIPQTSQDIELARQNKFNPIPALTGNAESIADTARQNIWDKVINGFQDVQSGFKENYQTPFSADNLRSNPDKTVMNRIGEALGTAGRIGVSPAGRGLIVGGLVGATGGSPLDMLVYGGKTATDNQKNKMKDELYRNQLSTIGYKPEQINKISSYLDSDTYKNLAEGYYKTQYNSYRNRKLDQDSYIKIKKLYDDQLKRGELDAQSYLFNIKMLNEKLINDNITTVSPTQVNKSNDTRKTDSTIKLNDKRGNYLDVQSSQLPIATAIKGQNANANTIRANAYNKYVSQNGFVEGAKGSGRKNPDYGAHLAEYYSISQSGDKNKTEYAKQKFMKLHGENPDKALKRENELLQLLMDAK